MFCLTSEDFFLHDLMQNLVNMYSLGSSTVDMGEVVCLVLY